MRLRYCWFVEPTIHQCYITIYVAIQTADVYVGALKFLCCAAISIERTVALAIVLHRI